MKSLLLTSSILVLAQGAALALTINLDAEKLKDAAGELMQVTGLIVLTTGTSGIFNGPTPEGFTSGDEIVLKKWDLSAFGTAGAFSDTTGDLQFSGNWNEGDPLRIYWYPTLTLQSTAPEYLTPYGTYRDAIGLDGSDAWITPATSGLIGLEFFTSDAQFLADGGPNSADAGKASLTVVPEPSAAILGLVGIIAVSLRRRARR